MRAIGRYSVSSFLSAVVTISSVGLAIVLAITVFLLVTSPWIDLGGNGRLGIPVALALDEQALHLAAPSLGATGVRLTKVTGTLEFEAPSRRMIVAPLLTVALMLVVAIWVLHQLRSLFQSLRNGQVFARDNIHSIQRVGWAVMVAEPVRAAMTWSAQAFAQDQFVGTGIRFTKSVDVNLGVFFCGLVILVIAEVFRAGTKLDEDQSLTI